MSSQLGEAFVPIRATLDKLDGDLKQARSKIEGALGAVSANVQKIGGLALTGAAAGILGIGAAAVAAGTASLSAFIPFEQQMNEVFTLLPGISKDAMDEMTDQVIGFSKEFGALPNEVVPALYQSISAGVPADNVFSFLETAQKAAIGGVTELETAVDGISSVVNAYGADVIDAARASDLMFTAVKLGKTDFEQLSGSLFNVIPTAASLGVEFGDVTAALASLTAQGTPTSVATTQMRQLFVELSKSGGEAAQIFEEMAGVTFKEFIAQGGNTADALAIMEQAAQASGIGINDLFSSVEAGNAALGLTGKGSETYAANLDAMANSAGATDTAFETMDKGLGRAIERLKAFGSTALLQVGDSLGGLAGKVLNVAEGALPKIQEVLDTYVTPAVETVTGVIGSFITNLQEGQAPLDAFIGAIEGLAPPGVVDFLVSLRDEILPGLSAWFAENVQPIVDMATEFVSWKDILIALGIAIAAVVLPALYGIVTAAAPVIATGLALVAIISLARNAWENDWGGIRSAVAGAIDDLQPYWERLKEALNEFWQELVPALQEVWQTLVDVWQSELQPALSDLWTALQDLFEALGFGVEDTDYLSAALGFLKIALAFVLFYIDMLSPTLEFFAGRIKNSIDQVKMLVEFLTSLKRAVDAAIEPFKRLAGKIGDLIERATGLPDWLIPGSPTPFERGLRGIGQAINAMPDLEFNIPNFSPGEETLAAAGAGGPIGPVEIRIDGAREPQAVARAVRTELERLFGQARG